jgi:hypothetical protein
VGCSPCCAIVTLMPEGDGRLGSAGVRWNDYVGTAAADDAEALLNTRSLYEIAELDRDRWMIVGIDLSMGSSSDPVVVYAVDRHADQAEAAVVDAVVVTAFHLGASVRLDEFLREAFRRVSVRLLSSQVSAEDLLVAEHSRR